jgi:hypothetical protein
MKDGPDNVMDEGNSMTITIHIRVIKWLTPKVNAIVKQLRLFNVFSTLSITVDRPTFVGGQSETP